MNLDQAQINLCLIENRHQFRRQLRRARTNQERQGLADKISASIKKAEARRIQLPEINYPPALPVSTMADKIVSLVKQHRVLIVAGETGNKAFYIDQEGRLFGTANEDGLYSGAAAPPILELAFGDGGPGSPGADPASPEVRVRGGREWVEVSR